MSLPVDEGVREKELSFLRAQFASMAERRGRPPALAKAMVDPDVEVRQVRVENELVLVDRDGWDDLRESGRAYELVATIAARGTLLNLTARQAVELRFADGLADTLDAVLVKLGHTAAEVAPPLERSAGDRLVVWIERLTPLLILAGITLAYLELKLPGFGMPGILAALCFLLVVAGKYFAGLADVPHVLAVGLGLALIVVELLVAPGTLWFGVSGAVLLAGALVAASLGPGFSFADPFLVERLLDTGIEYVGAALLAVALSLLLSRWMPRTPLLRRVVLVPEAAAAPGAFAGALPEAPELPGLGALGRALTDLRPVGKVAVDAQPGAEYEARSLGPFLAAGARVRVVEVGVGRLVVESAEGARA
jgi:membrane-bound serine protease (ClpP class)